MTYAKAKRAARRTASPALCGQRGRGILQARRRVSRTRAGFVSAFLFLGPRELNRPDLLEIVASLSPGIGLVVRDYESAETLDALLTLTRRKRRLCLLAPMAKTGFGRHCPRWQRASLRRRHILSMSVHSAGEAIRARRVKADIAFISPVFPTLSHPGGKTLGVFQARLLARLFGGAAFALGGMDEKNVKALGPGYAGFAARSGLIKP